MVSRDFAPGPPLSAFGVGPRVGALLVACAAAAFVGSCGAEDKSGACTGTMNGAYFRLEIGNFLVDTSIDVRVNGRFIGHVGKGKLDPNDGLIDGTVKKLGEFPVCDKMVIDARGSSGTYTQKFCSKPAYLSPSCSGGANDFCWETFALAPQVPCTECDLSTFFPAQPSCPCLSGSDPGTSWEKC